MNHILDHLLPESTENTQIQSVSEITALTQLIQAQLLRREDRIVFLEKENAFLGGLLDEQDAEIKLLKEQVLHFKADAQDMQDYVDSLEGTPITSRPRRESLQTT